MLQTFKENYLSIFRDYPVLVKLASIALFAEIGYSLIIPTLPLYLTQELKASVSLFGWVIASYAFTETILKIPSGYFADHLGRKMFIATGSLVPGFAIAACIFVHNPYYFIPLWGLVGFAAASLWPNLIAKTSEIVEENKRAQSMAVFNGAYMFGLCLGPPLVVLINKIINFEKIHFHLFAFLLSSLFFIISGIIAIFFFQEKKVKRTSRDLNIKFIIFNWRQDLSKIFMRRLQFRIIFLISFLQMLSAGILSPVIIIYANSKIGLSEEAIRLLFLPLGLIFAIFSLPLGKFVDKIGKYNSIKLSFLILSGVLYLIPFSKNIFILIFYILIMGIGISLLIPAWFSIVSRTSRRKERGLAIGSVGTAQSLGFVLGPILGGCVYDYIGVISPFIFSASILIFCLILSIIYLKEEKE